MSKGSTVLERHFTKIFWISTAILAVVIFFAYGYNPISDLSTGNGKPVTPLQIQSLQDDTAVTIGPETGRPMVLHFWSSSCPVCRQDMVYLEQFHQAHGGNVQVTGISLTGLKADARNFIEKPGTTYLQGIANPVDLTPYRITSLPTTLLVDQQGQILQRINSPLTKGMLENTMPFLFRQLVDQY